MLKVIERIGEDYFGQWTKARTSCRGIVVEQGKILLSYESGADKWMIPGGGVENGEDCTDCCIREVLEETGYIVQPSECILEIWEYCEDNLFINRYYPCTVTGTGKRSLTENERANGLTPRWLAWDKAMEIYASYPLHAATNIERCGLYHREYTALCEFARYRI